MVSFRGGHCTSDLLGHSYASMKTIADTSSSITESITDEVNYVADSIYEMNIQRQETNATSNSVSVSDDGGLMFSTS